MYICIYVYINICICPFIDHGPLWPKCLKSCPKAFPLSPCPSGPEDYRAPPPTRGFSDYPGLPGITRDYSRFSAKAENRYLKGGRRSLILGGLSKSWSWGAFEKLEFELEGLSKS